MPFDLPVPIRFRSFPDLKPIRLDAPFLDETRVPVPCDDPKGSVVSICLDTDILQVGDVFLFHRSSPLGLGIETYQRICCGLTPPAATITHVAIYAGKGMIWDHNPRENVRYRTVSSALQFGTTNSVSRPKPTDIDPKRLSERCAYLQQTKNYELLSVVNWRALRARATRKPYLAGDNAQLSEGLVCSTFVAQALDYASLSKFTIPEPVILPGDFVRPDRFSLIDLEWCCTPL